MGRKRPKADGTKVGMELGAQKDAEVKVQRPQRKNLKAERARGWEDGRVKKEEMTHSLTEKRQAILGYRALFWLRA